MEKKKKKKKKEEESQGSLETVRHCVVLANGKWGSMGYEIWILIKFLRLYDSLGLRGLWFY